MAEAMQALNRYLPGVAGGNVIYSRGDDVCELSATFGRSEFQVEDADGVRLEFNDRDFIFLAETLILSAAVATPDRGDRVRVIAADGTEELFEVLAPAGYDVFRYCDPQKNQLRVHTKRIQ